MTVKIKIFRMRRMENKQAGSNSSGWNGLVLRERGYLLSSNHVPDINDRLCMYSCLILTTVV